VREVPAITGRGPYSQGDTIDELRDAIAGVAPTLRDARWGKDTLEVCLAVLESSMTGRQIER
jgi:phthalate 4,5-cis-dihydrodiol dehydrogenase